MVSSHLLGDLEELADRVVFVDQGVTVGEHRIDQLPVSAAPRPWRVRALDHGRRCLEALKRLRPRRRRPRPASTCMLTGDEAAAALLAGLVRKGCAVVSCQPLGGQLEATYLELTQ